jgi:hypothetical protein
MYLTAVWLYTSFHSDYIAKLFVIFIITKSVQASDGHIQNKLRVGISTPQVRF